MTATGKPATGAAHRSRIAIVGAGVAGLVAARLLGRKYDVRLFEANARAGGHSHTVTVNVAGGEYRVDTGFIVCNNRNYPLFLNLLEELKVSLVPAEMSFSVSNPALGLEYNGHNLNTLFAQRRNLWRGAFGLMLYDILRFNRIARRYNGGGTVGEFIARHGFGDWFAENYLLPMTAAIWSCEPRQANEFPMGLLAGFFANHGLLDLFNRPRWYSVAGGSRSYVAALCRGLGDRIEFGRPVRGVSRLASGVRLRFDQGSADFDQAVLACHSDEALALLESPDPAETEILGAIPYRTNAVTLHQDASLMPDQRRAWASWNFRAGDESRNQGPVVTYCMNILQRLRAPQPLLVSLNAAGRIATGTVLGEYRYSHPQFSERALAAQARRGEISGAERIHYCGAWCYHGFHEDAVRSAVDVCRRLGVAP